MRTMRFVRFALDLTPGQQPLVPAPGVRRTVAHNGVLTRVRAGSAGRELHLDNTLLAELRMLTVHPADLAADRTRTMNRLRLLGVFPALERALDFTNRGPLMLISQSQTPAALTAFGREELERWLRERNVRHANKLAAVTIRAGRS